MKAIIFDFDGTIVDTEQSELAAWQHIYAEHELNLPHELWKHRIGTAPENFDPFKHLQTLLPAKLERQTILQRRREKYLELVAVLTPLPGVLNWIEAAHRLKIRMCIATASRRVPVIGFLEQLGFSHYFETVISRDDVTHIKPHPEAYLTALTSMGLTAADAIAIEDSPNGATAAIAAGLRTIIVPSSATAGMPFPKAYRLLASLEEITLEEFLAELKSKS
jgi:HAD superfamily hydrolase (TIGR01509 family)